MELVQQGWAQFVDRFQWKNGDWIEGNQFESSSRDFWMNFREFWEALSGPCPVSKRLAGTSWHNLWRRLAFGRLNNEVKVEDGPSFRHLIHLSDTQLRNVIVDKQNSIE